VIIFYNLILNSQKKYQKEVCDKMTEIDAFRQFLIKKIFL